MGKIILVWLGATLVSCFTLTAMPGCGSSETAFEKALKESQAAKRELHRAEAKSWADALKFNREQQAQFRETGGQEVCAHLRAHQLYSSNPILAKEAREYLEKEC